jgi:L-aspartate oxidase
MNTNVLIIGAGIAGLTSSIYIAQKYPVAKIIILSKTKLGESNTMNAQGGIAVVQDFSLDSFASHSEDTMKASGNYSDKNVVSSVINSAPELLQDLIGWGAEFDKNPDGSFNLAHEGGHSHPRIIHRKDSTGKEILNTLISQCRKFKNIEILSEVFAMELLTENKKCLGVKIIDSNQQKNIFADNLIMASGGIGQIFPLTSNHFSSTGDGITMAMRVGAKVSDLEFMQFHPTLLYTPDQKENFLISETVRGAGGYLLNENLERFMKNYDPRAELATRDVVTKAIQNEIGLQNINHVWLDCRHFPENKFAQEFPNIYRKCEEININPALDLIPVVPAAHYLCGGIDCDLDGKTSIENLFAVGECARTGLHGRNRLASNSLLEALHFAKAISKSIKMNSKQRKLKHLKFIDIMKSNNIKVNQIEKQNMIELKSLIEQRSKVKELN